VGWIEKFGTAFYFPKDWRNGMIEAKVRDIGMKWNDDAFTLCDTGRVCEADRRGLYA
jgi:hypothetical protein